MRSWGSLLPYFLYMARNYESEAVEKFLLPSQPDEGNFTSRTAYETALKTYQCNHMRVMEVWEWANELAEVHLEVDRDMVCTMHDLTRAMGRANMGVLSVVGAGAPGVSM